ncbi:MAG: hypothetical protein L0226_14340, partial [Acidobacteria bacterium]|nr:hypothetical protein [Acidobacteriota bacterium]
MRVRRREYETNENNETNEKIFPFRLFRYFRQFLLLRILLFSLDHKIIGIQYFFLSLVAALLGTLMSLLMRLRLAWPQERWHSLELIFPQGFRDGLMQPEFYLAMVTMHGTLM